MADIVDRMTIIEHLEELRNRLIRAVIAILVASAVCYLFSDQIIALLKSPAGAYIDRFVVFGPMDGFIIKWKVALYGGIVFASPIWAWQSIQFILPGLTDQEKRFLYPALLGMVGLFLFGTFLGYLSLPATFNVLVGMMGDQLEYLPRANEYISLVTFMLLAWGIAFETPIVILGLVQLGFLHPNTLRRQRRVAYFILFVFAQIVTPVADPFIAPMLIMAPMVVLFEISIRLADRIVARREREALPTPTSGE
jgi:sec-independent protein translocase protein TatC